MLGAETRLRIPGCDEWQQLLHPVLPQAVAAWGQRGQMGEGCWPGDSADMLLQRESWGIGLLGTLYCQLWLKKMLLHERNLTPLRQEM